MGEMKKRGQMVIFVIVAIVIVAAILILIFYPRIKLFVNGGLSSPQDYLKNCMNSQFKTVEEQLNNQGGYMNPEGFILYNQSKVKFLCYTSEYYKTCVVQTPLLINAYQQELGRALKSKAISCFSDLKNAYESDGYTVSGNFDSVTVQIELNDINLVFNAPLTVTKQSTDEYKTVEVKFNSQMFEIISIAQSIVQFESTYGDSEITTYLQYYPNLQIQKMLLSDGTKIYKVSDVISKEQFVFASRSLSWPPGYGSV